MRIKEKIQKIKNNYVINQVKNIKLPNFEQNDTERYKITFSGRVQKVGFRLEVQQLAKRLELTGFCKNLENGDVVAEFQGPKNKIEFLVSFMESLKRIKIARKVIEKIELQKHETDFIKQ